MGMEVSHPILSCEIRSRYWTLYLIRVSQVVDFPVLAVE